MKAYIGDSVSPERLAVAPSFSGTVYVHRQARPPHPVAPGLGALLGLEADDAEAFAHRLLNAAAEARRELACGQAWNRMCMTLSEIERKGSTKPRMERLRAAGRELIELGGHDLRDRLAARACDGGHPSAIAALVEAWGL